MVYLFHKYKIIFKESLWNTLMLKIPLLKNYKRHFWSIIKALKLLKKLEKTRKKINTIKIKEKSLKKYPLIVLVLILLLILVIVKILEKILKNKFSS